jgi:DNA repair photolyase
MRKIEAKSLIGSNYNFNLYRGCSHGCIYCDSRSLCYQIGDFNDIMVKTNAISLLDQELTRKRNKVLLTTGSMSDPYLPLEKDLKLMRGCLEVINKHGFGIGILTKSDLILRDSDLLKVINDKAKVIVDMTITTYDDKLCKVLEPNVAPTSRRFEVLKEYAKMGIEVGIWLGPILPFINDDINNLVNILGEAHKIGVSHIIVFAFGLTLREGNREYFYQELDKCFPQLKARYIKTFGNSYECLSPNHKQLWEVFKQKCDEYNISYDINKFFCHKLPSKFSQLTLF